MNLNLNDLRTHLAIDENRWPGRDGRFHAECPFCRKPHKPGQTHFSIFDSSGTLAYKCQVCGKGGFIYSLFRHFGIEEKGKEKITRYTYQDEENGTLYVAIRCEPGKNGSPKSFWQELPDGSKRLGKVRRVLYHLPDVVQAVSKGQRIWIVEGEKDADRLKMLGLIATTNVGGAGKWKHEYDKYLNGADVIIIPDNDDVGIKHANQVASSLSGVANVRILNLPGLQKKGDVSDWLNMGGTVQQLLEMAEALPLTSPPANKHHQNPTPANGTDPAIPKGYYLSDDKTICSGGKTIYNGIIGVVSTGRNVHTNEEFVTVGWNGRGLHDQTTIPRTDLARSDMCAKRLAVAGAAVHAQNAGPVSCYLTNYIQENWERLPRERFVDRYGLIGDGVMLPAGTVGVPEKICYTGKTIQIGNSPQAYQEILKEIETWGGTRTLWAILAFVLASPIIARIDPDRNPVIGLSGRSGVGKTTLVDFALGTYGNPSTFTIQCGSGTSTKIGMQQALTRMNGMPVFFDDIQTMMNRRDGDKISGLIYDYANKQGRFIGTLDQRGREGERIGGTMLLVGETLPQFSYAGQSRRTFNIDCSKHLPLGTRPNEDGARRAASLREAVRVGSGHFGFEICRKIWNEWDLFIDSYERSNRRIRECYPTLAAWSQLIAAAGTALKFAFQQCNILDFTSSLMDDWARIYLSNQEKTDPATEAFDKVINMLAQCSVERDGMWTILMYERRTAAVRRGMDPYWRILCTTTDFNRIVGDGVVHQFGEAWREKDLIIPHKSGVNSQKIWVGRVQSQCILVSTEHILTDTNISDSDGIDGI